MALVLTLRDDSDPHDHWARATQRDETRWDVKYWRGEELVSEGGIGTPPPNMPPTATLLVTLREMRREADYWTAHETPAP